MSAFHGEQFVMIAVLVPDHRDDSLDVEILLCNINFFHFPNSHLPYSNYIIICNICQ